MKDIKSKQIFIKILSGFKLIPFIALLSFIAISCSIGENEVTNTGKFIDSPVQGVFFQSGNLSGITNSEGGFVYEVKQPVKFTIGDLVLGSSTGKSILSPVDLVPGGTINTPAVINIARLLQSLDSDPNDAIISIPDSVRTAMVNSNLEIAPYLADFSFEDNTAFESAAVNIINNVTRDYENTVTLVSAETAFKHLEANLEEAGKLSTFPPGNVVAAAGDGTITVSWDLVTGADSYNIYLAKEKGVNTENFGSLTAGQKIISATNPQIITADNENTYYLVVTAVNSAGESYPSTEVLATPKSNNQPVIPTAPANVQATPGNGEIQITWDTVNNASSYNLYIAVDNGVSKTHYQTRTESVTSPHTVSADNDTTYYIIITASNTAGESDAITPVSATPTQSVTIPFAPADVQASAGDGEIQVTWSSVSNATSYNFYIATDNGVSKTNYQTKTEGVTSPHTSTAINGTTYYIIITAVNTAGESGYLTPVSATPTQTITIPSAPTGVNAAVDDLDISLTWSSVTGATSYNIYRATESGLSKSNYLSKENGVLLENKTSPDITNASSETTFYYIVTAKNTAGESVISTEVSGVTDFGGSCNTAHSIALDSPVPASLATSGDKDFFEIVVPQSGSPITISTSGSTDTLGRIYGSSCAEEYSNDDGGDGNNFSIYNSSMNAGTYYISVESGNSSSGSYTLSINY
jgi:hypothetical protein